jgi:uncharacterized protein (DUF2141 family)
MSRLNPIVLLLSVICLAAGILLYPDSNNIPFAAKDRASLASTSSLPGYTKPPHDQTALNKSPIGITTTTDSETYSSDTVASETTRSLAIHITGLKHQASTLYVAVFDSAKGFPKPEHSRETTTVPVTTDTVEFSLSLPNLATTGIAIFQDLNGDGKLTKNSFGLPIEPYGFSNNPRSTFGPPSFSQTTFEVSEKMPSMEISVR